MASGKDRHYWTQLLATLTAGNWDVALPAKAPNGTLLPWSELLRKFNKHCHGYGDVAELASQTQALALVLESGAGEHTAESQESGFQNRFSNALDLDDECVLLQERREEAAAGYAALKDLRSADKEPVKLALAYYAYALGRPEECLALLSDVSNLADVSARVAAYESMRADSSAPSASLVSVVDPSASTSRTGSLLSVSTIPRSEAEEGRLWGLTECIRSITLEGMSHERLSPQNPQKAIDTYMQAVPLINAVIPEIQRTVNPATPQVVSSASISFARFREMWRWAERCLRRAIILVAQASDPTAEDGQTDSFWALQGLYRGCSAHWPATFHPELRSTVATVHLRAFVLRARLMPSDVLRVSAPRWISNARSVLQELRALLSVCTRFPRAGERNVRVEDFVDLCVAVWEADGAVGEYAGWAIDFLWWATRLTFNSYRIYRHMARLLGASGDPALARRTLKLYVQVVSKAREADADADADSDRLWVQTLVHGANMLCRLAVTEADHGRAVELAKEAGVLVQKAKTRLESDDKEMLAAVQLAEGIWYSVMAFAEQDPRTRNAKLAHSLEHFTAAVGTFPTASAHHHLALALSRPGPSKDLATAITHARAAVELAASEVRHWHLLGLLLAATGDWQAAQSVLDLGIDIAEAELTEEEPVPEPNGASKGLSIRDFVQTVQEADAATVNGTSHADGVVDGVNGVNGYAEDAGVARETILPRGVKDIPPSAGLLQPASDRPEANRQEKFEYALQTRMTQLALTEFVEGAEAVGDKWLEVFQWFREKRPATLDDRRQSIDSRRVSVDVRSTDVASMRTAQAMTSPAGTTVALPTDDSSAAIPPVGITITPATPATASEDPMMQAGEKRSASLDEKDRDVSRGKKVREVLKSGVHKGQARITTISKKMAHGVGRHGSLSLKRTTSAPDFHSVLAHNPYQASSIHLRQYHSIHASQQDLALLDVPPPPRTSSPDPVSRSTNSRTSRDLRLLSDLWLMSAAIFRRLGKIEQAKGAIQEAEVRDEDNPAVWVQLGLYHSALGDDYRAAEAFRKALFIRPNDVSATIYLCRIYLSPTHSSADGSDEVDMENVDLAAGLLSELTRGAGWDVPEAWYFLARACKLQGRRDRERECLNFALTLSQTRGVRDPTVAVGWCL